MAKELKVPKLGMDMEEANILRWLVEDGAEVEKGDPVIEIDTDKVSYEVEANADGIIRGLRGGEGETIPVGAILAFIAAPDEEWAEPESEEVPEPAGETEAKDGKKTAPDVDGGGPATLDGRRGVRASPAARRAAQERGLAIEEVAGSGPGGRIYLSDVLEADVRQGPPKEAPAEPATPAAGADDAREPAVFGARAREPLSRVRRVGGERTARSFGEVPHFYLARDLQVDRLLELRERLKLKLDPPPTVTDLFVLAAARKLKDHPRLNARYVEGGEIELNERVNVGVAAATDEGLLVPVLRGAEALSLLEISAGTRAMIGRARDGKLSAEDLSGGTFTISNLGMMGVDQFDAIIDAPQAAILALGRARTVPEWRAGEWAPARVISATLSVDHRVADGADGARFLHSLQDAIQDWELLL